MKPEFYFDLTEKSISNEIIENTVCEQILLSNQIELLPLLNASFTVRKKFCGKTIKIHILNNVQNGLCPEDCSYCAQSKNSKAPIEKYSIKSDEEIIEEAKSAYENGAFRYCMVYSGRGPTDERVQSLCALIKKIKSLYNIEVCVSAGIMNQAQTKLLKKAGLDRMNHNLNTSENMYSKISKTHTYQDRINTLEAAHNEGLQICSGVIIGMGESTQDVIDMAMRLRNIKAESIPVNFYIPIEGVPLKVESNLTPEYCLRVLCLFRLLNPRSEVRVAAGRELHLRDMEVMAFYPANSLFLDGYLNAKGSTRLKTLQMLKDAGFEIESDKRLDELIAHEQKMNVELKGKKELRFTLKQD